MRLFVQINIGGWQENGYDKPFISYASSLSDDILGTDVDSQSDSYIVGLVRQLLEQSKESFIYIEAASENQPLDAILSLLNHFFSNQEKIERIALRGRHSNLERMFQSFEDKLILVSEDAEVKNLIRIFAKRSQ